MRIIILIAGMLSISASEAGPCRNLAAAVASGLIASATHGSIVVDNTGPWPFDRMAYLHSASQNFMTLTERVDLAHTRFEDSVFFEGSSSVYNTADFPADRFLPTNIGPLWRQVDGEWNSVVIAAPNEMPLGVNFGVQTILDPTPHTPNLVQWTEINWSNFPFTVVVTHKAWIVTDPRSNFIHEDFATFRGNSIPNPSGAAVIGIAGASLALSRTRRR